jgi:hypothetical protein
MSDGPKLVEVPQIHDVPLTDVAGMLRKLADRVEKGDYGDVECLAIALLHDKGDGNDMAVLGFGRNSALPMITCTLLNATYSAALRFTAV